MAKIDAFEKLAWADLVVAQHGAVDLEGQRAETRAQEGFAESVAYEAATDLRAECRVEGRLERFALRGVRLPCLAIKSVGIEAGQSVGRHGLCGRDAGGFECVGHQSEGVTKGVGRVNELVYINVTEPVQTEFFGVCIGIRCIAGLSDLMFDGFAPHGFAPVRTVRAGHGHAGMSLERGLCLGVLIVEIDKEV